MEKPPISFEKEESSYLNRVLTLLENAVDILKIRCDNLLSSLNTLTSNFNALNTLYTTTEKQQRFHAWVNFDGTGANGTKTPRNSYNVSNVNKTATGDYTITFSALPDANYFVTALAGRNGANVAVQLGNVATPLTTTTASVQTISWSPVAAVDAEYVLIGIVKD